MTNREKFKDELIRLRSVAVTKEKQNPTDCGKTSCINCLFYNGNDSSDCNENYQQWLNEEYIDPKKQPSARDTEIMKACKEIFDLTYFAKDEDGEVCGYKKAPQKGNNCWQVCGGAYHKLETSLSHLSWEDKTPYYFKGYNI